MAFSIEKPTIDPAAGKKDLLLEWLFGDASVDYFTIFQVSLEQNDTKKKGIKKNRKRGV